MIVASRRRAGRGRHIRGSGAVYTWVSSVTCQYSPRLQSHLSIVVPAWTTGARLGAPGRWSGAVQEQATAASSHLRSSIARRTSNGGLWPGRRRKVLGVVRKSTVAAPSTAMPAWTTSSLAGLLGRRGGAVPTWARAVRSRNRRRPLIATPRSTIGSWPGLCQRRSGAASTHHGAAHPQPRPRHGAAHPNPRPRLLSIATPVTGTGRRVGLSARSCGAAKQKAADAYRRPPHRMEGSDDFDCEADFSSWRIHWGPTKMIWCCAHARKGCALPPFDCASADADFNGVSWLMAWKSKKKAWCCHHEQKLCD